MNPGFQVRRPGMALLALAGIATWVSLAGPEPARGQSRGARPGAKAGVPARRPSVAASLVDGNSYFTTEIQPIIKNNCLPCHGGDRPQGNLNLTTRAGMLKGGNSGPAVSTTQPGSSLLLAAVNYRGRRMPPRGKLPAAQISALTRWVGMGAPWPSGEHASLEQARTAGPPRVTPETMKFWSFQPVRRPDLPATAGSEWVRNPVDAFILARLKAGGLAPNPPATREALIRRATYDLTGLPPTPEEVRAFLADTAPDAWEKVVDRLLASPRYGEKWGRHWLDLVRFAESNSYERDGTKPNAWRYRDYVINSFNEDKPYDRFVLEQLAGDEIAPRKPEGLIATGFYRLGIWDDEPADPEQALYDDLDDIASTTAQVFLGLTVNCARCHDHKLDPIPQRDYYRFLAFFSGVRRFGVRSPESVESASLRPIASEAQLQQQRERVAAHLARLRAVQEKIDVVERRVQEALTPVEKEEFRTEQRRVPIVRKQVPALVSAAEFDGYLDLLRQRSELRRNPPSGLDMALCVTEIGATPRSFSILLRGNPHVKGEPVEPGFPSVLAPPAPVIPVPEGGQSCGRRLALARWIAASDNPLTARVMANRVWQYHFGRGIVRSPNNFGFQGDKPTHPELLDWLAYRLANGSAAAANDPGAAPGSLKALHRLIMTSNAYRMSSRANPAALAKDPENNLIWRFDMRRLQAEEVRDSILAVNGSLNLKMAGPGIYPTIPAEVLAGQSMPGAGWGRSSPEEQCRRSVYIFVKRSLMTPLIESFDGPETDFTCPVRFATTQPTQALGMINSEFINEQARVLAASLRRQAGDMVADQVRLCLWRTLQREPGPKEVDRGVRLIEALQREERVSPEQALTSFCVVALNLNEFLYLD